MKNPIYKNGELTCGECGKPMACSDNKFGDSLASCSDTGCKQGQQMIESGSTRHNPMVPAVRRTFQTYNNSRYVFGGANYVVKDGLVSGRS